MTRFQSALLISSLSLLAGVALSGCGDSGSSETNPCDACNETQTCIENVCYENSELCGDSLVLCTEDQKCVDGTCKPKDYDPEACDNPDAKACDEGYTCDKTTHRCVENKPVEETCDGENAKPCDDGYKCDETTHKCIERDPCDGITCLEGKVCLSSIADCLDVECIEDNAEKECPIGQMCSKGACIDDGCLGVDCPENWQCVKGTCEETACIGKVCNEGRVCVAGECIDTECLEITCEDEKLVCSKGECMFEACIGKEECKQGKLCGEDGECHFENAPSLFLGDVEDKTTDESGKAISISVNLNNEPAADVRLKCEVTSESPNPEAAASCDDIVFNPQNWSMPQTIIVTGLADHFIDADQTYKVVLTSISEDAEFADIVAESPELTNLNIDKAGYVITPSEGLQTGEDGTAATFTMALAAIPTAEITVTMSSSNTNEGTISADPIVFTPDNWNVPVEVTINGVNDDVADGNKDYQIDFAVVTEDSNFKDVVPDSVKVTNIDDDKAGIAVQPAEIKTTEGGEATVVTVKLTTKPNADVELTLSINDDTEASVDLTSLKFTADNWNTPQEIKISGLTDQIIDGAQPFVLSLKAASEDAGYQDISLDVNGTNEDSDRAGFITILETSPIVTEAGTIVEVKASLASKPASEVTVGVSVSDATEISVDKDQLKFDAENWNVPQVVSVKGVDDHVIDGDVKSDLILTASSEDKNFDAASEQADDAGNKANIAKIGFATVDDDKASIVVTSTPEALKENEKKEVTMTVALSAQPENMVFVTINSSDSQSLAVTSGNSLIFTADNWDQPQTVKASVIDDLYAENNKDVVISFTSASSDKNFNGLKGTSATYTIIDNETINIVMTASPDTLSQPLGIKSSTITTVLSGAPSSDVTIQLTAKTPGSTTLSTSSLKFTSTTWNIPQTFTATTNFKMPQVYDTETITGTASGSVYDGKVVKVNLTVISIPEVQDFNYTGAMQNVTLYPGKYKLEVWGAQGGTHSNAGGKGGYSTGIIDVKATTNAYVAVGQLGSTHSSVTNQHGFNGGGNGTGSGGDGGGATHIATANGELATLSSSKDSILVVAGGGGGGSSYSNGIGGAGGGTAGSNGVGAQYGYGGTQTAGGAGFSSPGIGKNGEFGLGATSATNWSSGGGGGAGYYGGGSGGNGPGGGGSGFVNTTILTTTQSIAGNASMPAPAGSTETGHTGNGFARITLITD